MPCSGALSICELVPNRLQRLACRNIFAEMVGVDIDQLRIGGFVCAQKGGHPFIEAALHSVKDADRYGSDHGSTCSASLLTEWTGARAFPAWPTRYRATSGIARPHRSVAPPAGPVPWRCSNRAPQTQAFNRAAYQISKAVV